MGEPEQQQRTFKLKIVILPVLVREGHLVTASTNEIHSIVPQREPRREKTSTVQDINVGLRPAHWQWRLIYAGYRD